eukprot:TRINITY_DN9778_c0_g1_i2.p1 TRINITY_DN9778_c0_g1~~TRINITY_DN9778_c0_g1_i2.p1  ORF type:complete len:576 (+),score=124.84 TRINITY_DN9778_c0_g1_i2:111-1838(+)
MPWGRASRYARFGPLTRSPSWIALLREIRINSRLRCMRGDLFAGSHFDRAGLEVDETDSKADLGAALHAAIQHSHQYFKQIDFTLRFIIISLSSSLMCEVDLPVTAKMHLVVLGEKQLEEKNVFSGLAERTLGCYHFIKLPEEIESIKDKFHKILQANYAPFVGHIMIGHINSPYTLYPNPNSILFNSFLMQKGNPHFPTLISIVGFMNESLVLNTVTFGKFIVLPLRSVLSTTNALSPDQSISVLLLLHETLKKEKKVALVSLSDKMSWFGCIQVQTTVVGENSNGPIVQTCLVLVVFPKQYTIDWVGNFSQLSVNTDHVPIPLKPTSKRSYDISPGNFKIPCAETATLTADISKVLTLVKELPAKSKALYEHCEKIRTKVNIYFLPGVLDCLIDLLGKSYDISPGNFKIPCAETATLTADISKVLTLVKELPAKSKALYEHCEKIRTKVNIYFLPGVLDCLIDLLGKELKSIEEDSEARYILEHLVEQVKLNRGENARLKPLSAPAPRERTKIKGPPTKKPKLAPTTEDTPTPTISPPSSTPTPTPTDSVLLEEPDKPDKPKSDLMKVSNILN